jgi:hypothetical protein
MSAEIFIRSSMAPLVVSEYLRLWFFSILLSDSSENLMTNTPQVGTLTLLVSATGLAHLLNGSLGAINPTGATAIRDGGGLLGYWVAKPLVALMTSLLAYPVLIAIFFFGLLIATATPLSKVGIRIKVIAIWLWSKKPARNQDDFEISDTPPFESPVVAWNQMKSMKKSLIRNSLLKFLAYLLRRNSRKRQSRISAPNNFFLPAIQSMNFLLKISSN